MGLVEGPWRQVVERVDGDQESRHCHDQRQLHSSLLVFCPRSHRNRFGKYLRSAYGAEEWGSESSDRHINPPIKTLVRSFWQLPLAFKLRLLSAVRYTDDDLYPLMGHMSCFDDVSNRI